MPVIPKVFCVTKGEKPLSKGWDAMMKVWDETQARRSTMIDEHKTVVYRQFPSSGLGEHFMGMMENMDMEKYAQWATEPEFKVIEEKSGVKQTDYDLFELKQFSEAEFATLPDFIPYLVFKIPISKGYDRFMQVFQAEGALRQKCCNDVETRVGFASDPSCMLLLFTNVVKAAALQIMGDPVVNKNWADNGIVLNEREFFIGTPLMPAEPPVKQMLITAEINAGFAKWKAGFDGHVDVRSRYCDEQKTLAFSSQDEKTIFIYCENFRMGAFGAEVAATKEFQDMCADLGQVGPPKFYSLAEIELKPDGLFTKLFGKAKPEKFDMFWTVPVKTGTKLWLDGFWALKEERVKEGVKLWDEDRINVGYKKNADLCVGTGFDCDWELMEPFLKSKEAKEMMEGLGEDLTSKKMYTMTALA